MAKADERRPDEQRGGRAGHRGAGHGAALRLASRAGAATPSRPRRRDTAHRGAGQRRSRGDDTGRRQHRPQRRDRNRVPDHARRHRDQPGQQAMPPSDRTAPARRDRMARRPSRSAASGATATHAPAGTRLASTVTSTPTPAAISGPPAVSARPLPGRVRFMPAKMPFSAEGEQDAAADRRARSRQHRPRPPRRPHRATPAAGSPRSLAAGRFAGALRGQDRLRVEDREDRDEQAQPGQTGQHGPEQGQELAVDEIGRLLCRGRTGDRLDPARQSIAQACDERVRTGAGRRPRRWMLDTCPGAAS